MRGGGPSSFHWTCSRSSSPSAISLFTIWMSTVLYLEEKVGAILWLEMTATTTRIHVVTFRAVSTVQAGTSCRTTRRATGCSAEPPKAAISGWSSTKYSGCGTSDLISIEYLSIQYSSSPPTSLHCREWIFALSCIKDYFWSIPQPKEIQWFFSSKLLKNFHAAKKQKWKCKSLVSRAEDNSDSECQKQTDIPTVS